MGRRWVAGTRKLYGNQAFVTNIEISFRLRNIARFRWFCLVLGRCGLFVGHFGLFWVVLHRFGLFLGRFGSFQLIFWVVLGRFGSLWLVLSRFGSFWFGLASSIF